MILKLYVSESVVILAVKYASFFFKVSSIVTVVSLYKLLTISSAKYLGVIENSFPLTSTSK